MASLQRDGQDMETYALANAIGAATIAQLKLSTSDSDAASGIAMEAECQRSKLLCKDGPHVNLHTLRTAFFLHVYHENMQPGGPKSLLYLREAITMAQVLSMHRESSYLKYSIEEQQIRRRILWLLFVTERGVAMLHKLPVILKPNAHFPSMEGEDESRILPAFQKLVNLFWIFDQSGAFDILQDSDADNFNIREIGSSSKSCLDMLQRKLQDVPLDWESSNDVQRADICVTRQWMRAVLWRVSMNHGRDVSDQVTSLSHPIQIAKEFLGVISQLPNAAIEAHGPSMEYKIYEIASAVTDALVNTRQLWDISDQPREILHQLQRILASSRGGNKMLVSMLCSKMASIQHDSLLMVEPSSRVEELDDHWASDSTTSPEAPFDMNADYTFSAPASMSSPDSPLSGGRNGFESNLRQDFAMPPRTHAQLPLPDFMDFPWAPGATNNASSLAGPTDLFEQLQHFDGSFNDVGLSGSMDRFIVNNDIWDGANSDVMLNLMPETLVFQHQ
ncbi:fungal specific transcription factor-2 [Coleophoma crateriformis]|uniref:Fungal specific transcription factor-2 n=1 Tax=Coleophoma crateriformis TaxID=565419 RepID=A0A3D8RV09_9HELO|nr:fungal specific transcription factor-2 [Coleophoma crateriformis]